MIITAKLKVDETLLKKNETDFETEMHWVDASGIKLISYSSEESASKPKAKFNQETRDFLENLLKDKTLEERIASLEIRERQKYLYYCDCSDRWTTEEDEKYQSQWNEIIQMLNEAKEELKNISLIQEEKN